MRFYSGFSFKLKWRYLKWLAIPLFLILSYFSGSYGYIKTYALVNNNTTYEITMPNYNELLDFQCGNYNFKEELDNLLQNTDTDNLNFGFSIMNRLNNTNYGTIGNIDNIVDIYFYSKIYLFSNFSVFYQNNNYLAFKQTSLPFSSSYKVSHIYFNANSCTDLDNNTTWNTLKNALENNVIPTKDNNNYSFPFWWSYGYSNAGLNITNDMSYSASYWYYYTNYDLYYSYGNNQSTTNSDMYFKKLHIIDNDSYYTINSRDNDGPLPSYVDIYGFSNNNTDIEDNNYFIGSKNSLGTIYTNFEPSYINHFDLNISFNSNINYISGYDYYENIDFTDINCYGRINHNDNYYSYEKFSYCTFELDTDNLIVSSDNDLVEFSIENLEIYNSNDIKITDFSNYDKIFIYLDFQYDDNTLNTYVSNLNFSSSMNMLYLDYVKGEIFDDFDLPSYFKMFISNTGFSNDMSSNISVRSINNFLSSNNFLYSQPYSTITLEPTQVYGFISTNFQNLAVNNSQNLGYMIYHQINNLNLNLTPHLDMILMRDIIISFRNMSSNNFYYADDTGTIINNNIEVDYSYGVEESFGDITGLLPPGPLDSLLNIPFKYLSKTINSLNETCSPLSIPFVFDSELTFPCFDTYYEEFPSSLKIFTEVVPCAFILIFYFKHLYTKISRATTLETTENDEWGCL